jgi:hypothetical protein
VFAHNLALGGKGGSGGSGGNGGNGLGGGIFNGNPAGTVHTGNPILDLDGTTVTANQADGGAAGSGGVAGAGVGGGLYNEDLVGAIAQADAQSKIKGNHASTSNDDVFGTVTPV